jgi:two-component system sensor histidine kinase DctS/two-component system sensor kinase FixL
MIEADMPEQVIGHSVYPLIAEEDRERYRECNERIFRGDSAIAEFTLAGMNGTRRRMESHSVPLRNEHGRIFAALSITRDVTQQRKSESELRRRAAARYALADFVSRSGAGYSVRAP